MKPHLEGRMRKILKKRGIDDNRVEFWISKGDGFLYHPDGRKMTEAEFRLQNPHAKKFTPNFGSAGRKLD